MVTKYANFVTIFLETVTFLTDKLTETNDTKTGKNGSQT
jgi:hypothetical protein